ncbi:complex I intermediate-associated protein 30, mitochondrial [Bicyclus anynana]|uniref:Complex I intermediate-associated protein 30, mitochondrial n=1 Tax=Bicyclus anynana TaxID=110368 RepID=A0A6J1N4I3_BICAN|nr:complex I intermediate-associated protein 30, mitochondrial [Bicyclus anynana]
MALCRNWKTYSLQGYRSFSILCRQCDASALKIHSNVNVSPKRLLFWEKDRKGGYDAKEKVSTLQHIMKGFKEIKSEFKLLGEEAKEFLAADPLLIARPGETDLLWCFNEPKVLEQFVTTSDSDHNQGYSSCSFSPSPAGRALFHGYLDTRVPKDGRVKKAGYCALRSQRTRKAFKREATYNWHLYNTLVVKLRGDGRSYLLNISCEGYYDITWNDIYHYVLFTRGGPYWQIAKIPFSKFILGSKGLIQDKQSRMRLDRVTHFGISCGDKIDGPFNLELEYIGLEFDPTHDEDFAYEMYKTDRYIVGV